MLEECPKRTMSEIHADPVNAGARALPPSGAYHTALG